MPTTPAAMAHTPSHRWRAGCYNRTLENEQSGQQAAAVATARAPQRKACSSACVKTASSKNEIRVMPAGQALAPGQSEGS